ncbi:LppM family (lipo)protein [Arthrobacter cupressi]|uniref:LppM domain-containing protein n=1 Tax=Arthrobacter cupressi TaxID=1045773 RepID=A0A1G8S4B2_9MICC|nr:hypothetical protein [Arthrobacter cupressi]NYD79405.1 hypothetical protein [Arthrobacter cupressi]SDJ24094.1 hypothetical protein SAMN05216555_108157 [Arthrobacter cupressi]
MRPGRAVAATAVLVAVLFSLTGCFKLNMDIKVHSEKSVDYEVVYALQKDVLKGKSFDEFMKANDGSADMTIPEGAKVEEFEDADYKGKRISAVNIDPAKIAEAEEDSANKLSLVKEGDFYVLTMGNLSNDSTDPQGAQIAKAIFDEAVLKVTFPGKIVEANGAKIDGNAATIDFLATDAKQIRVKAESSAGFPLWILWGGIALLVVIAGLILLFVLLSRRKAQPAPAGWPAPAAPGGGPVPGAPVPGPTAAAPPSNMPPPSYMPPPQFTPPQSPPPAGPPPAGPPPGAAPPVPGHPPAQPGTPPAQPGRDGPA